jgi:hypothetical protein
MSFEFQLYECSFTDDVKVAWQVGQREKLYAMVEEWSKEYHEEHTDLMSQVAELLRGIEFMGDATFIPLHPCIMCIRDLPYGPGAWLPFYFESMYRDPTIQIVNSSGTFIARFVNIPVVNVARNVHTATAETDPSTLDFVPHRLARGFFRLKPYGYDRLFYSIETDILATALGGKNDSVVPLASEDDADERAELINDVYRFGWTGLEFTPIWKG